MSFKVTIKDGRHYITEQNTQSKKESEFGNILKKDSKLAKYFQTKKTSVKAYSGTARQ